MAIIGNLRKIPGKFEAHALPHAEVAVALVTLQAIEKVADGNTQHLRDLEQASGGNAIDTPLVLVGLLVCDPDDLGHSLLAETEHDPRSRMRLPTYRSTSVPRLVVVRAAPSKGTISFILPDTR